MGNGENSNVLYLIDYGLAKHYEHLEKKEKCLIGTAKYASIPAHQGKEQAPRDDLESMCYTMLYLLRGGLPWEGILVDSTQEKYDMIGQLKVKRDTEFLCKGLPGMLY
jgi:casein kinase 1